MKDHTSQRSNLLRLSALSLAILSLAGCASLPTEHAAPEVAIDAGACAVRKPW